MSFLSGTKLSTKLFGFFSQLLSSIVVAATTLVVTKAFLVCFSPRVEKFEFFIGKWLKLFPRIAELYGCLVVFLASGIASSWTSWEKWITWVRWISWISWVIVRHGFCASQSGQDCDEGDDGLHIGEKVGGKESVIVLQSCIAPEG